MSRGLLELYKMFSLKKPIIIEDMEDVRIDDNKVYSTDDIRDFLEGKITRQSLLDKLPAKDDN